MEKEFKSLVERTEKNDTFARFGIYDIPFDLLDNYDILTVDQNNIEYINKISGEICRIKLKAISIYEVFSGLEGKITIIKPEKNTYESKYHQSRLSHDYKSAINSLQYNYRKKINLLKVKFNQDVLTEYGDFCLEVEETYSDNNPYIEIALYYSNYQTLENEENDKYKKYGILKFTYNKHTAMYSWKLGYNIDNYDSQTYLKNNKFNNKTCLPPVELKDKKYEDIVKDINEQGAKKYIEQLIEGTSKTFDISIPDLLGIKLQTEEYYR